MPDTRCSALKRIEARPPVIKTLYERDATAPPHPGEILKEDFLARTSLNAADLACHIGLDTETTALLLDEATGITGEIAAKLGAAFETGPRFWLALQMQYDLWASVETGTAGIKPLNLSNKPLNSVHDRVHASA